MLLTNDTMARIPPNQATMPAATPKQSFSRSISLTCKLHIQPEWHTNLMCHAHKISSTSTSTLSWRFVPYLDPIAVDRHNLQPPNHKLWLWQQVVCFFNMQDVSHSNLMISAVSWQPKPQLHISISDGLACDPFSNVTNLPLFPLGILCVPFELSPISANVRSCVTI